ncbi:hypothetical protein ACFSCV_11050 [Methylopila henanensis]|uniref:Uncharacterized protein n=1 Tax=Methylopila henanensis TaxID=873516 RepID=A0ABW4K6W4_9HYPH
MSNILKLFAVLVIAAAGYWSWYAAYGSNPNEQVGVALTRWMPGPLKDWGCGRLNERFQSGAPTECSPVADSTSI